MNRLTLMFRYGDEARADVAITPDKVYYRFATDDSIEDGELPPLKTDFETFAGSIVENIKAKNGENNIDEQMKVEIFVDNRILQTDLSQQSLRRTVEMLYDEADEFAFLQGFCKI